MKHRPVYHCCNQISPEQQPVIYRPLDYEPRSGHYYRKPHYQYEPKKSRNCINSICAQQVYTIILLLGYIFNTTMLGLSLSGNVNVKAFEYLNSYCPRKMQFLFIIQMVISSFGVVFYLLQQCITGTTKYNKMNSQTGYLQSFILIWICLKVACAQIPTENTYCFFDNFLDFYWNVFQNIHGMSNIAWPMSFYWILNILNFIVNFCLIIGAQNIIKEEGKDANLTHYDD